MDPTDLHLDLIMEDNRWSAALPQLESLVRKTFLTCFQKASVKLPCPGGSPEISVVFANNDMVRKINKTYRGKDCATNVISFAYLEDLSSEPEHSTTSYSMGDIIVAFETLETEAKEQHKTLRDHTIHLLVHGCLHLFGYRHDTQKHADEMEQMEIQILNEFDVKNPYTDQKNVAY